MARDEFPPALRRKIYARSKGRCEIYVEHGKFRGRCTRPAMEIHHMLTKARGGRVLDKMGETIHLIHLCWEHHRVADGYKAYEAGLLIEGSVVTDKLTGRAVYSGPDPDLRRLYPGGSDADDSGFDFTTLGHPTARGMAEEPRER